MKRISAIATLALGLMAGASAVQAADIIEDQPYVPEATPVVQTSGWYLRGDVGTNFKSKTEGNWDYYNWGMGDDGIDDTYHYDKLNLKSGVLAGIGAGYRFNEFLRTDATVDYFHAKVAGSRACPYMVKNAPDHGFLQNDDECNYGDSSKADVWTTMANLYVDLPYFNRFTPYVGAGVGAAYVDYDRWNTKENCPNCPSSYTPYQNGSEGSSDWRWATALMAGASYDLTSQLKLDVGYRFLHIGKGDAFEFDDQGPASDKANGASGVQMRDNGFNIHQVRAGLRYEFF
ncbi:outer membrane protein [Consotaella salsifontis]|uniref:Opacity protein n=1 Tax=Consotaella salsifontis TaxID=1365950 RepID=A0A1T4RE88_9HYPH|nr:outer membrane protein [Consotaella salsifontis]SKA14334.1 Opacity protein [Consotaella salsifontis]